MSFKIRHSLSTKLTLYFLVAAFTPLLVAAVLTYILATRTIQQRTFAQLQLASNLKDNQISTLVSKESELVQSLSRTQAVATVSQATADHRALPATTAADFMALQKIENDFSEIFYIDAATGTVAASSDQTQLTKSKVLEPYYIKGKLSLDIEDLYFNLSSFTPRYTISLPVKINGVTVGVFGAHLKLDTIDSIMAQTTGLGDTGETYLINQAHQFVSQSRFNPSSSFNLGLNTPQAESVFRAQDGNGEYVNYRGHTVYGVYKYIPERHLAIFAEIEKNEALSPVRTLLYIIIFFAATLAILLSLLVIFFTRTFLRPIRQLTSGVQQFGEGNLQQRIVIKSQDEVQVLATAFNQMAQSIEDSIAKLRELDKMKSEFLMIASHNLRTPITIIQGYLSNVLSSDDLSDELRDDVQVISATSSRLSIFAEDILTVSKLDAGQNITGEATQTNLRELLDTIVKDFSALVKKNNLVFESDLGDQDYPVLISPPLLRAAIWNVLDNALKFTKEGEISVTLRPGPDHRAIITVTDTGIGISAEEVPKLFTKFHRGTSTTAYNYEGTGIGLYLTKLFVERNNGTIGLTSVDGKGTTATITFPLDTSSKGKPVSK